MDPTADRRPAAIILAAGLGTRLRPLTDLLPKALCPVANRPLLDHALDAVTPYADDVAVNAHAMHELVVDHLDGRPVHVSVEPDKPLGTAGGVANLREWLAGRDVLVTNADAWRTGTLAPLVDGWDGERVRLLCVREPERGDFGPLRYAGACLLPAAHVARLDAVPSGLYEVLWREELDRGRLELVESDVTFVDCGTPADYLRANLAASGGASVVGEGAVVEGLIERCVVWPNSVVGPGERLVESIRARHLTVHAG